MPKEPVNPVDEKEQFIADCKRLFKSDAGYNVLRGLSKFCGESENPYVQGSYDRTANKCGKLSVILFIRRMLADDGTVRQEKVIQTER